MNDPGYRMPSPPAPSLVLVRANWVYKFWINPFHSVKAF